MWELMSFEFELEFVAVVCSCSRSVLWESCWSWSWRLEVTFCSFVLIFSREMNADGESVTMLLMYKS